MKRITVSLPDELVDSVRRSAGGEGQVSSYVAAALVRYQEQESLSALLESWHAETPLPDDVRRAAAAELDGVELIGGHGSGGNGSKGARRKAG